MKRTRVDDFMDGVAAFGGGMLRFLGTVLALGLDLAFLIGIVVAAILIARSI